MSKTWLQVRLQSKKELEFSSETSPNVYEIAIYNSNVEMSKVFWEWRHKVITVYLSLMTAIGGIAAWLYQRSPHRSYEVFPLLAVSGVSFITYLWEKRVRDVVGIAIQACAEMENQWCVDGKVKVENYVNSNVFSAYTMLRNTRKQGVRGVFSTTIPLLFGMLGIGSLILACVIMVRLNA